VPTRKHANGRRVCTTSGAPPLAGGDRTGRRGLTQKTPAGNGRSDPAMRSKSSHAAKSGVGEHTARESECAQCMRRERARGERPLPNLAPEPQGSGALFFYRFVRSFLQASDFRAFNGLRYLRARRSRDHHLHLPAPGREELVGLRECQPADAQALGQDRLADSAGPTAAASRLDALGISALRELPASRLV